MSTVMGKNKDKNKGEVPNPTSVSNRDVLQRLNFLYQASVLLNGLAPPSSIPQDGDDDATIPTTPTNRDPGMETGGSPPPPKSHRKKRPRVVSFGELSRSYVETMKSVGQKTNVRIDPSVKRCICKRCSTPLIPGISATVRIQDSASHGHLVAYRCHCCQAERRIPAPPVLRVDSQVNEDAMQGQEASTGNLVRPGRQKRKRKGPQPRLPPHFARDVGHVVFRGNERLEVARSTLLWT